ncbi:MAG: hypothetical protein GX638_06445 [Crenarchaeota archaeon]|nr:hypothetical protein [Thermoproteota archaeon]
MKYWNKSKKGDWLILGYIGGSNTGDDAMLQGLLLELGPDYSSKLAIFSRNKILSPALIQLGYKVFPFNFWTLISQLIRSDGIIQVGGTIFHDSYPSKKRTKYLLNLSLWSIIFAISHILGKKILLVGVGVGPLFSPIAKAISAFGLRACHMVTLRDQASMLEVRNWIPENRLAKTFDLAALLQPSPSSIQNRNNRKNTLIPNQSILGISILSFSIVSPHSGNPDFNFFDFFTNELIDYLDENPKVQIRIFVFWAAPDRENDIIPSMELMNILEKHAPGRTKIISYNTDPSVTLAKISECRGFISTRYHAAVLAYIAGCNFLAVLYHRKLEDFMSEIKLSNDASISPYKIYKKTEIKNKIQSLMYGDESFEPKVNINDAINEARKNVVILKDFITDTPKISLDRG